MTKKRSLCLGAALAFASIVSAAPSSAAVINVIDGGGVAGTPAERGFAAAAAYWSSVITNDVVINFTARYGAIEALGTADANYTAIYASDFYGMLQSGASSALDRIAISNLAPLREGGGVSVTVPDYFDPASRTGVARNGSRIAPDGTILSSATQLTTANMKALVNNADAYRATYGDASDGILNFSSTAAFDFDPTDGITVGHYDFIGTAIHEIGHALGFVSGTPIFDAFVGDALGPVDNYPIGHTLDFFRYSAPDKLDWTFGTEAYFSIDGGRSALLDGYMSTGVANGDGFYSGHWKRPDTVCGTFLGIMQPYACPGGYPNAGLSVSALDLAALDAIGWNFNVDALANSDYRFSSAAAFALVPEPTTWMMMIAGFGMIGAAVRRKAAKATVVA